MALVKYGGGIIQMSGSIAGNTFARNRSGNYVRARTKPVNPRSARQVTIRSAIAFLTARWSQTLTANQRIAWQLYADSVNMKNKLGEVIKLSGFNHYIRSNSILKQIGAALVDDGPVIFELPDADPTYAITASEGTQLITITFDNTLAWAIEDNGFLWTYHGQPQNPQRNFFAGPWRSGLGIAGAVAGAPASPADRGAQFAMSEGQRNWCYARIQRADGRLSEKFYADTFCAA